MCLRILRQCVYKGNAFLDNFEMFWAARFTMRHSEWQASFLAVENLACCQLQLHGDETLVENYEMSGNRPLLSDRTIQIVAENRICTAIEAGEFDDLPGFGKPATIFDEPYDPHWWIRRKLQWEALQRFVAQR